MQTILSVLFYIGFFCFTVVYFIIFCLAFIIFLPFDKRRSVVHWMSRFWARFYFGMIPGWEVKVEGRENVDKKSTYVIVVNHRSMLDILLMYIVPLNFRWVSKKEVYKLPLFGWVLWMHGDIAIERGASTAMKKMVKDGKVWIRRRVSVTVFPEGTRSKSDQVGRFKEGAFALAKSAGVGVLPCVIDGTDRALKGWKFNFKNKFNVRILEPISAEQVKNSDIKELTTQVQSLVAEGYQEIRENKIIK